MIHAREDCCCTGCKALATKFWQIVGLLSIPWGNTVHWNLLCGSFKLMEGTEKANLGWSSVCKGIVEKQSLRSVTNNCQFLGIILGLGRPGCKAPIGTITALTDLKSVSIFHLPDFFCIMNTGKSQGVKDSMICPLLSCSLITLCKASNSSCFRGHCSIHTGWSVFQLRDVSVVGGRLIWAVATSEKQLRRGGGVWNLEPSKDKFFLVDFCPVPILVYNLDWT